MIYPGDMFYPDIMFADFLPGSCTAFLGTMRIASGDLADVAHKIKELFDADACAQVLIFDDVTSRVIEVDFRGTLDDVVHRISKFSANSEQIPGIDVAVADVRRPGRPKLGVVAREVTLLPRHWAWLADQPGGASVALRKLVEYAARENSDKDRTRRAQEATYRFISALAGNEPHFEEATRSLFAGRKDGFIASVALWPVDVREHAQKLADAAFQKPDSVPAR